ncbi:DUF4064 domain-containing protein [Alkalihalophilus marmarensis]|uniref:DUF4064 domain-containing protein n=1 Tax=Alkalihalophilus marmarensis TaxID=521377 RepID=UPI0009F8A9AF|nr:DUF4064 domain-containing protein [Alkalihalophilus marmarensis]
MNVRFFVVSMLSILSIALLASSIAYLSYMGPLEQNSHARHFVIELYNKDPKVQRDSVNGTLKIPPNQFATDTLRFLHHYLHIPIGALALSVTLNIICLFIARDNKNLSGSLFMCAAAASSFTLIPPILQVLSGILLLRERKLIAKK